MRHVGRAVALAIALTSGACATESVVSPDISFREFGLAEPDVPPLQPLTRISVPTYDGSGQAVHPDVLWFPGGWHGFEYWMAFTPYPGAQIALENPSIVVSHDGRTWQVPPGLTNPVVPRPRNGSGYNSDPDLSYDAAHDRLVMLAREVRGGFNRVSVLFSSDGTTWSQPRLEFLRRNHGIISPAMVLQPNRDPRIWFVDAGGTKKCPKRVTHVMREEGTAPGTDLSRIVGKGWGPIRSSGLSQKGYNIWHMDVSWVPALNEYWAVYPAYPARGCGGHELFFAHSPDGNHWTTYPVPLIRRDEAAWMSFMLYRASALYDPARGVMRLYLSAARPDGEDGSPAQEWRMGMVEFRYTDLLARLAHPSATTSAPAGVPAVSEDSLP